MHPILVVMLFPILLVLSSPAHAAPCAGFTDVEDTDQFCADVAWIRNRGVTLGCTATTYCPGADVTRLQMAAFMHRLGEALFPLTCSSGQVMKWNGTLWACANDAGATANAFVQNGNMFGTTARLGTLDPQPLELVVNGIRAQRFEIAAAGANVIGGSVSNAVLDGAGGAFIGAGGQAGNCASSSGARPCGNRIFDSQGVIGGGRANEVGTENGLTSDASGAVVSGGQGNTASALAAFVGGGLSNHAAARSSVVPGGEENYAGAAYSLAAGRMARVRDPVESGTVLGDAGTWLWADSIGLDFASAASNEFAARATGGFRFVTDVDAVSGVPLEVFSIVRGGMVGVNTATPDPVATITVRDPAGPTLLFRPETGSAVESGRIRFTEATAPDNCLGAFLHYDGQANLFNIGTHLINDCLPANDIDAIRIARNTGFVGILAQPTVRPLIVGSDAGNGNGAHVTAGGVWTNGSSAAFKERFASIDSERILDKVATLPISQWSYRGHEDRHIGPTAEDFHAAFGLGDSTTHIGTVDTDGVALAAIQGLNARLEAKAREIASQRREIDALVVRLQALEALLAERTK